MNIRNRGGPRRRFRLLSVPGVGKWRRGFPAACPDGRSCQQLPRSFPALRAEVPDDGGMRRVIGWLRAAVTLIFGSAYAALRQLGRRSATAAPAAAVAARAQLVDSETRSRE